MEYKLVWVLGWHLLSSCSYTYFPICPNLRKGGDIGKEASIHTSLMILRIFFSEPWGSRSCSLTSRLWGFHIVRVRDLEN